MKNSIKLMRRLGAFAASTSFLTLAACGYKQADGEIQGAAGIAFAVERAISGLERKQLQIDGFTVPYLQGGKGEPLVLIHGFGGSKDNFNNVSYYLTKHYTVYALDIPGFGASTRNQNADYGIDIQTDRIHAIIEKLGLIKPHIAGNSMGGWLAGTYAARYPDEVSSIWFLSPAGLKESTKSEVLQHFEKTGENLLTAGNREEYENILDVILYKRPAIAPAFVIKAMAEKAIADQELHERIYKQIASTPIDMADVLKKSSYKGPALIVWGKEDRVLHPDGAAELKLAMPQARLILMDKTGHVPMMEHPKQVAQDYLTWRKEPGDGQPTLQ